MLIAADTKEGFHLRRSQGIIATELDDSPPLNSGPPMTIAINCFAFSFVLIYFI
jgi:hypothetical protein